MNAPILPPRFEIIRPIGEGGMGVVYEARDHDRGEVVALKTIREAHGDPVYRLKREFRALAGLEHPNLVRLYDLFADADSCFFTMELLRGTDLASFVAPHHEAGGELHDTVDATMNVRFDESALRAAVDGLCAGVEALHRAGLLHRDLKPSNVIVTASGRVVVLDFGLVADAHAAVQHTQAGAIAGTLAYMAPEQGRGETELTSAVDLYAVGVILFELLTGQLPFEGSAIKVLMAKQNEDARRPSALVATTPTDLDDLTIALLARDPTARPSLAEVRHTLTGRGGRSIVSTSTKSATPPLLGRDAELALLRTAYERTAEGRPSVVLVRGRSGIGKSALIAAFTRQLEESERAVVLTGRCYESETVPYKGLDGVVDALSRHLSTARPEDLGRLLPPDLGDLATLFPVLRRIAPIASAYARRASADRTPQRIRAQGFACLREMLRRIAETIPLLVVVDDVQWADEDTARALVELLRDQHPPSMLVVLGARPGDASAVIRDLFGETVSESIAALARASFVLEPLDATATRELVRRELGDRNERVSALVETIAAEAQGNPFAVGELVRFMRDEDPSAESFGTARSIDDVVVRRAEMLDDTARALLDLIAIAGEPTDADLLRRAAGLSVDERSPVDRLRAKLWVRSTRAGNTTLLDVVHDRMREAVALAMDPAKRRALHRALALAMETLEHPPHDRLARHFAAAGDRALGHLHALAAAEQARESLALRRAVELYALTLELADETQRRALLPTYAAALSAAGKYEASKLAWMEASTTVDAIQAREYKRNAAEATLYAGRIDDGLAILEAAAGEVGLRPASNRWVEFVQIAWERFRLVIRGRKTRIRPRTQISVAALDKLRTIAAVAFTCAMTDQLRGVRLSSRWLRVALDVGDPEELVFALWADALISSSRGATASFRISVAQLEQFIATPTPVPAALAVLVSRCHDATLAGDYRTAIAFGDEALAMMETVAVPARYRSVIYSVLGIAWAWQLAPRSSEIAERFAYEVEEEAGRHAQMPLRAILVPHLVRKGLLERVSEAADGEAWSTATKRMTLMRAIANVHRAWALLYEGEPQAALAAARSARFDMRQSLIYYISLGKGVTLCRLGTAAFAAGEHAELRDAIRALGRGQHPALAIHRLHLEALAAFASGEGIADALRRLADYASQAYFPVFEASAHWALGRHLPPIEAEPHRRTFDALIEGCGFVDPDRYFWTFIPVGDPPPRTGATRAAWPNEPVATRIAG